MAPGTCPSRSSPPRFSFTFAADTHCRQERQENNRLFIAFPRFGLSLCREYLGGVDAPGHIFRRLRIVVAAKFAAMNG